jgi:very-short-patch-repair endonuclease
MTIQMNAVAQLAATQHGKVHYRQLRALGWTRRTVQCAVDNGRLIRERGSVYAVGHEPDTPESRWSGAVLAAGPGAALSHLAAARHWKLLPWEPDRIDVTRPRSGRPLSGVVCHGRPLDGESEGVRGIVVTSAMRTIADCAEILQPDQLVILLREARHLGLLDIGVLEHFCRPGCRRRGAVCLRMALARFTKSGTGFRSRLEQRSRDVLVRRGAPEPLINVTYATDIGPVEVDQSWPALNICVEVDGPTHQDAEQQRVDERNRGALRRAGWDVHVIPYDSFAADPWQATEAVSAAIARKLNATSGTRHVPIVEFDRSVELHPG